MAYPICTYALSAKSAVLIDADSSRILYEHNCHEKLPMASTTKIMTGLIACKSEKLTDYVTISPFASCTEGSSLWLKPGDKVKLEDLTYGLLLNSGNDAAVAIAEHLTGSIDSFSLMMNIKAQKIGALNTSFKNPHGLYDGEHYTTAYDLALISREAMKNSTFRKIVSTKKHNIFINDGQDTRYLNNHNKLLDKYDSCIGVKTGYTKKSGRCLVTCAEKEGKKLICVTLNAPDDWNDHISLLNYGFENFRREEISKKGEKAYNFTYDKIYNKSVELIYSDDFNMLLGINDSVTTKIKFNKLNAPVKKGTVAGHLEIFFNGEKFHEIELLTAEDIKKVSLFQKLKHKFHKLISSF